MDCLRFQRHPHDLFEIHSLIQSFIQDYSYHEEPIVSKWLGEIHQTLLDSCRLRVTNQITSPISIKNMMKKSQIAWDVVITSMLVTMGSCCVVGRNEEHINGVNKSIFFNQGQSN